MNTSPVLSLILALFLTLIASAQTPNDYQPGPDSKPQPGVPKGEVLKFSFDQSKIFPGTTREYWIYVPAQYTPDKPACLYVNQDGIQYEAPTVFDNLIHKKEMPVTVGVFVMHGKVKAADESAALDRFNRSYEEDFRRARDPPLEERQRPRHRRLVERRDCRVHGCLGAPRRLHPRLQRDRHLCRPARRRPLPLAHPQVRAEAHPRLSAGRVERQQRLRRRLVDGQPDDGARAHLRGLRSAARLGRGRAQRQARHGHLPRRDALALEGLAA